MCIFPKTPKPQDPVMPPEYAQQRAPDGQEVRNSAGNRTADRIRAGAGTVLTSGSGVTQNAATEKKTLLGA